MAGKEKAPIKIIGERNIHLHLSNQDHHRQIAKIGKALSSPIRLNILNLLKDTALSLQEIADILHIPVSSTAVHVRTLEEAHLIITETQPGLHGSMRVCICSIQSFHLETSDADAAGNTVTLDMPVGNYHDFHIEPACGLADENGILGACDDVRSFYSPLRTRAQLLWFQKGFVEYRFPNLSNPLLNLQELSFQIELCSLSPDCPEDLPSDITVSVNGCQVAVCHCPGDLGGRRGHLTPSAWCGGRVQYGLLKTFSVRNSGSYLDGLPVDTRVTLKDLKISRQSYIALKIQVREASRYAGGVHIFGEKYGDFPQGILMSLTY